MVFEEDMQKMSDEQRIRWHRQKEREARDRSFAARELGKPDVAELAGKSATTHMRAQLDLMKMLL